MLPSKITRRKARRSLPLLLATLIFAGCTGHSPRTPSVNVQGDATGTSEYYLQQLQQSSDDNKVDWQLLAIRALLHEGKLQQASQQLSQLPQDLNTTEAQEQHLLLAQLAVAQKNMSVAMQQLQLIDLSTLSPHQQVRYYQLHIAAGQANPTLDVLRAHIALQPLLSATEQQDNIDATWQTLLRMNQQQLSNIVIKANENVLQGWLDLLSSYHANSSDVGMLKSAISDWQVRYPNNPAAKMLPTMLSQLDKLQNASVGKIALLLPLNGQAQVFSKAIQQGFDDARTGSLPVAQVNTQPEVTEPATPVSVEATSGNTTDAVVSPSAVDVTAMTQTDENNVAPETPSDASPVSSTAPAATETAAPSSQSLIQVYDTSTQPVEQILAQAQMDGATLVVGPLLKNQVAKVANSQTPLNVLALNELETTRNRPNVCYFALSPEDEARDAAHHMWNQGKRSPLLLVPRGAFGARISQTFAAEWQKLGGNGVLQQQHGATAELRQGINSGAGIRMSGTPVVLQSEPVQGTSPADPATPTIEAPSSAPSGRVDAVYIVATQSELALIKPMIAMRVSSRDNIGLYASSRSNQAGAGPDYRLEMDGLQFSDIPLLSGKNPALMQQAVKKFNNDYSLVRLYAMGIDAWSLANHFSEMRQVPGFHFNGNTGSLVATQDCVINRKLSWSQYHQGQIVPAS